jgi:hypothetical protein
MRKTGLARYMLKKLPVGIATGPFEFAFMAAYALLSGKYLFDIASGSGLADTVTLASLPLQGVVLDSWLAILFVSTVVTCVGLLSAGYKPLVGMRLERSGLCGAGAMILVYLLELVNRSGFSVGLGTATIALELLAVLYRVVLLGQALDILTEPKKGAPRP